MSALPDDGWRELVLVPDPTLADVMAALAALGREVAAVGSTVGGMAGALGALETEFRPLLDLAKSRAERGTWKARFGRAALQEGATDGD